MKSPNRNEIDGRIQSFTKVSRKRLIDSHRKEFGQRPSCERLRKRPEVIQNLQMHQHTKSILRNYLQTNQNKGTNIHTIHKMKEDVPLNVNRSLDYIESPGLVIAHSIEALKLMVKERIRLNILIWNA